MTDAEIRRLQDKAPSAQDIQSLLKAIKSTEHYREDIRELREEIDFLVDEKFDLSVKYKALQDAHQGLKESLKKLLAS